ncbi:MICOS complex subunit mic25a isoform X4 [Hippoglossus stenolepis]|uniref:MICOS complex subunit mic25a isoform X4 n=1 Tax=Hippoglossus stenolepis TaxID=195615 RepID=UPI00159C7FFF|nr:MICOS complex subunit mic25a isoform X4 [Hippoglossus stenolepis]
MGGTGSRRVSFGLDEDEKVTVIEGVKLSEDVLRWMKQPQGSDSDKRPPFPPDSHKPQQNPNPTGPSITEIHEGLRKDFERQQALVQEQLASLAQRERETAAATGLDELLPTLIIEKGKAHEEKEKAKMLNFDIYKESAEQYNQAATKAEAHIRPRQVASVCTELQAKVFQCYRESPQQTLHCSSLAKQYMTCVQQAKKFGHGLCKFEETTFFHTEG